MNKVKILKTILNGGIKLIDDFDCDQPALLEEEVIVTPKTVKKVLNMYLNGYIDEAELEKWADFICIRSEYVVPGGNNDEINDYYEPMYYAIQKLSTPILDGVITSELVTEYRKEFGSLKEPEELKY